MLLPFVLPDGLGCSPAIRESMPANHSESVALLIRHKVKSGATARYETWLKDMTTVAAKSDGHQGAQIIRPFDDKNEYVTIVHFASAQAADRWARSEERLSVMAKISDALDVPERPEIHPGVEFCFAPPPGQRPPKGWKQWLVTSSVIWPVSTLVQFLFGPLFTNVPALGVWEYGKDS